MDNKQSIHKKMNNKNSEEEVQKIREELAKRRAKKESQTHVSDKKFGVILFFAAIVIGGYILVSHFSSDDEKSSSVKQSRVVKQKLPFTPEDRELLQRIGDASLLAAIAEDKEDPSNMYNIVFIYEGITEVKDLIDKEIKSAGFASRAAGGWTYDSKSGTDGRYYLVGDNHRGVIVRRIGGKTAASFFTVVQ
ncbi:hypothetical protein [Mangrovibacterium sp.]|uniref:hypothetical protein n=1 Tax=Mangrovibacterium sp. TaxID=1961364 RepID=UPI0035673818